MGTEQLNDWDLLAHKDNTDAAFATLFERHKDYIFRLAVGFVGDTDLADDITQEVFIRIFKGRKRWTPKAAFTTWLYQVTLNTSRELLRKRNRQSSLREKLRAEPVHAADEAPTQAATRINALLRGLPEKQRETVILRFYEKMSVKETAAIMGCREGTVKSHLHKAVVNLRRRFGHKQVEI